MTKEQFAQMLDGREHGEEITIEEIAIAREHGLVVVFGASDDLMEFRGAIDDELDVYNGGTAYLTGSGLFENKCEDEDCLYAKAEMEKCSSIEAVWHDASPSPLWTFETDIPHAIFGVIEDDEVYCKGIVFEMCSLA